MAFFNNKNSLIDRIKELENQNEKLQIENDSLRMEYQDVKNLLKEREENISALKSNIEKKYSSLILEKDSELALVKNDNKKMCEVIQEYEDLYINTGLRCQKCHFVLHKNYKWCPYCGKSLDELEIKNLEHEEQYSFVTKDDGDGCLIVRYDGFDDKKIVIPSKINGKRVTGIWNNVFNGCNQIIEVFFEEGCEYIGEWAFARCKSLKRIQLPKSLKEIGDRAFYMDSNLEEIITPENVHYIGRGAFQNCTKLKRVILSDKIRIIAESTFQNCGIKEIKFSKRLSYIQKSAFENSSIEECDLPDNLQYIGDRAFAECYSLKKVFIKSNVKKIGFYTFSKSHPIIYCAPGSYAQKRARMNELTIRKIEVSDPCIDVLEYVKYIEIINETKLSTEEMENYWHNNGILGNKASKWSWQKRSLDMNVHIEKILTMDEFKIVRKTFENNSVKFRYSIFDPEKANLFEI